MPILLLADAASFLTDHAVLLVGVVIVLLGLLTVGRTDLARFSGRRVWAISSVCFAESIRRKVLWIIPLAIVGLVAIVQLQQPSDEQDAVRQTTKFCLYASGLVVVLTTLILACTNLPREIENRVIFTVVTKPSTRLEIVLGKIVGFARVSATILLVMGLFTWGYLHLRASLLRSDLKDRLAAGQVEAVSRPTFQHYVDAGLLNAKSLADPVSMDVFGRPPSYASRKRYLNPSGYMLVPFSLPANTLAFTDPEGKSGRPGARIALRIGYDPAPPAPPVNGQPATAPAVPAPARVDVAVFDPDASSLLTAKEVNGQSVPLPTPDGSAMMVVVVPPSSVSQLRNVPSFLVAISSPTANPLWVMDDPADPPVQMVVPVSDNKDEQQVASGPVQFHGRVGTFGQQAKGDPTGDGQTCVFRFRDVHADASGPGDARVPIEMRVGIEKDGDTVAADVLSNVQLTVTDPATGRSADAGVVHPENNRTLYASVPHDLVAGGNFDVAVRSLNAQQWVGLRPTSLSVVQSDHGFGLNLAKSLSILWLLSVLVTSIGVFSSTFLTWPTAVVFTLVLLFGRWGLNELGDAASAGLGRQFTTDFGMRDPALVQTVAGSVDLLNKTFKTVALTLPDVSAFSATDEIDRGLAVSWRTVFDAAWTLLGYGLPLTVLAFVIFKFKEVAP